MDLQRRGFNLGQTPDLSQLNESNANSSLDDWHAGKPVLINGLCHSNLDSFTKQISTSEQLYLDVLDGQECDDIFYQPPYSDKLSPLFEPLGCSVNEGDNQEIETLIFDAVNPDNPDEVLADDLWVKASWLSFYEEDASLRFRFSFGVDFVEDVAADSNRQHYAAKLTEAIFPESEIITNNQDLKESLNHIFSGSEFKFVERIVYFNSPDGGAYLHHDRERGHAGVVYAQLTGQTFWLALTKQSLIEEISYFINACDKNGWPKTINEDTKAELIKCSKSAEILSDQLDRFANTALIPLINETSEFVQQLINHGHWRYLKPGDVLLLPQESEQDCCWHSVFCLGEESGEALSFAIRRSE